MNWASPTFWVHDLTSRQRWRWWRCLGKMKRRGCYLVVINPFPRKKEDEIIFQQKCQTQPEQTFSFYSRVPQDESHHKWMKIYSSLIGSERQWWLRSWRQDWRWLIQIDKPLFASWMMSRHNSYFSKLVCFSFYFFLCCCLLPFKPDLWLRLISAGRENYDATYMWYLPLCLVRGCGEMASSFIEYGLHWSRLATANWKPLRNPVHLVSLNVKTS